MSHYKISCLIEVAGPSHKPTAQIRAVEGTFLPSGRFMFTFSHNTEKRPMIPSEVFMRHAAECKFMARCSRDRENREVWKRMAERWARCAELATESKLPCAKIKLHRKPPGRLAS
jgi:hypothetical protein